MQYPIPGEFSHLEIVGNLITMLLDGLNDDLKQANEHCDRVPVNSSADGKEQAIHQLATAPLFLALRGGSDVGNSAGVPWSGAYVNSNGEPSVDLRSNLAAESRAKIVYEYRKQFTDDAGVQDTLSGNEMAAAEKTAPTRPPPHPQRPA